MRLVFVCHPEIQNNISEEEAVENSAYDCKCVGDILLGEKGEVERDGEAGVEGEDDDEELP